MKKKKKTQRKKFSEQVPARAARKITAKAKKSAKKKNGQNGPRFAPATGTTAAPTSAPPAVTKIAIIEDAEASGEVAKAYDAWRAGSGRTQVPGIIKCFGARPDFLRQVLQFSNTVHFSEGHLSRRHKEMLASHVSYLNRCPY